MIKINIKRKNKRLIVPVPFSLIRLFSFVISSRFFLNYVNKAIERDGKDFKMPIIDRNDLYPLLSILSKQKGLLVVDAKLHDGTEIKVKL